MVRVIYGNLFIICYILFVSKKMKFKWENLGLCDIGLKDIIKFWILDRYLGDII